MLYWLYQFLPTLLGITMASHITDLVQMLPYVVTIVVLIVVSMRKKKKTNPGTPGPGLFPRGAVNPGEKRG